MRKILNRVRDRVRGLLVLYCVFPQKGIVLGVERLPCIRV